MHRIVIPLALILAMTFTAVYAGVKYVQATLLAF